ncbi:hypothetical protein D3C72_2356330 [compost metagenome]
MHSAGKQYHRTLIFYPQLFFCNPVLNIPLIIMAVVYPNIEGFYTILYPSEGVDHHLARLLVTNIRFL